MFEMMVCQQFHFAGSQVLDTTDDIIVQQFKESGIQFEAAGGGKKAFVADVDVTHVLERHAGNDVAGVNKPNCF